MSNPLQRIGLVLAGASLLLALGCQAPEVAATHPRRANIRESFSEPARTRLENVYPVTMPLDARIGRIMLEPGDTVKKGQRLVEIDRVPFEQEVAANRAQVEELKAQIRVQDYHQLEDTVKREVEISIQAAEETQKVAALQVEAARARAERAALELTRIQGRFEGDAASQSLLDDAVLQAETLLLGQREKEFIQSAFNFLLVAIKLGPEFIDNWLVRKGLQREVHIQQLARTQAHLALAEHQLRIAEITAPMDATVLERHERGDSPLPAGSPLLTLGALDEMEGIADVLSEDALQLKIGDLVELDMANRPQPLTGKVRRIEPMGFTKRSSLGVEQQRVNVIFSLDEHPEGLGVGYRLQARFITRSREDALIVSRFSVLQANDGSWFVFKIENGTLRQQPVKIGLSSDLEMEITEGLGPEDLIVDTPDMTMHDGQPVTPVNNQGK